MSTVNERLRDEILTHLVDLHRYANSEVRQMLTLLNAADEQLFSRLYSALQQMTPSEFTVARLTSLLRGVWEVNEAAYRQLSIRSLDEMRKLTEFEVAYHQALFSDLLPGQLAGRLVSAEAQTVYAAAMARPFRGRLLSDWFSRLSEDRQTRIESTLRIGYVSGKTVDEMIRDLRGTKSENYANGLLQIDRRNAEAVVRTATSHTAQFAREAYFKANEDILTEEQWVSTLDNRTTEVCQIRDGLLYTAVDHKPIGHRVPWLDGPGVIHWNCRSTSVPVIDSASALGIELPPLERASMDGQAAPGVTFREWIEQQPAERQDDVLGPKRGALLRKGKLEFESFFNDKGVFLTLDELKEKTGL